MHITLIKKWGNSYESTEISVLDCVVYKRGATLRQGTEKD